MPSFYSSKIIFNDNKYAVNEEYTISYNNTINYSKYRFFQMSYDKDEKGTILSVNYDPRGMRITYFGYILLILGLLMIFFNKNSHFRELFCKMKDC